jgi:hypothetical protein
MWRFKDIVGTSRLPFDSAEPSVSSNPGLGRHVSHSPVGNGGYQR